MPISNRPDLPLERGQLTQLIRHLDHHELGDKHMSYYGQLRAFGYTHEEALEETIKHFDIRSQTWHQARFRVEQEYIKAILNDSGQDDHVIVVLQDESWYCSCGTRRPVVDEED